MDELLSLNGIFLFVCLYYNEQTLLGDVSSANLSHREFYNIWQRFGVLPERYCFHPSVC